MKISYKGFFYNTDANVWEDPNGYWIPEEVVIDRTSEAPAAPPNHLTHIRVDGKFIHLSQVHYMERLEDYDGQGPCVAIYTSEYALRVRLGKNASAYRALLAYMGTFPDIEEVTAHITEEPDEEERLEALTQHWLERKAIESDYIVDYRGIL
jgi:hypothetical protein